MKEIFLNILILLYGIGGVVTFIGFVPTMIDLWKWIPSANILTYLTWTLTTLATSLYGFFILNDFVFNVVINLQLAACLIVLLLRLRLNFKK